jgi:hypothetical protein
MSKFDISDFNADELNQAIDDTNFPSHDHEACGSNGIERVKECNKSCDDIAPIKKTHKSLPMAVKPNGFPKSFDDEVFDIPGTPKTPRSLPTPGNNCE